MSFTFARNIHLEVLVFLVVLVLVAVLVLDHFLESGKARPVRSRVRLLSVAIAWGWGEEERREGWGR